MDSVRINQTRVRNDSLQITEKERKTTMISRREFLGATSAMMLAASMAKAGLKLDGKKKLKMAVVTTEWRYHSHAWHMAERFLVGYPINGKWHHPPIEVVSAYVDQFPENDLSRSRAEEFGFKIYPTVAEALRNGGDKLDVDAVLLIGEHGKYPDNELGQRKYPRYELFTQCTDVFKADGKSVPVFNDKHLSWKWEWAKEMVDLSKELDFPFLAGSSLPNTWRMPAVDIPYEAELDEVMSVAMGGLDSYDFHALETIQCMAERRRGGEVGIEWVQGMQGDSVWEAMETGSFDAGGWDPKLFEACLCRSQTLAQPETFSHRHPTPQQMREWVKKPVAFRFQYRDGVKGSMFLMNGLVKDFTFAANIVGEPEPLSTLFYLPPNPNVTYSAELMSKVEETFVTGKPPFPVERTLLTAGLLESALKSLAAGQKPLKTPHLDVKYQVSPKSLYANS